MTRIPDPDPTRRGPEYQGRLLDRPDEEVVDQGLPFDLRTMVSRRGVLALLGAGGTAALLAACTTTGGSTPGGAGGSGAPGGSGTSGGTLSDGEIPEETAGPYPGDGSNGVNVLEDAGVVRSDIRSSIGGGATAAGVPMELRLTVLDQANGDVPFAGVAVYVWHCDAQGRYSLYSDGVTDESYLRGVQVADADGVVSFTSIFPACYSGRWPHIHFEVYPELDAITDAANAIATSQVALPADISETVYALVGYEGSTRNLSQVSLAGDTVFGDDGGELQLAAVTGDAASCSLVELTVRVDTSTAAGAGGVRSR